MYDLIRKIHLYTGLTLLAFVLMYFVTGYVMIHHDLFPGGDRGGACGRSRSRPRRGRSWRSIRRCSSGSSA